MNTIITAKEARELITKNTNLVDKEMERISESIRKTCLGQIPYQSSFNILQYHDVNAEWVPVIIKRLEKLGYEAKDIGGTDKYKTIHITW